MKSIWNSIKKILTSKWADFFFVIAFFGLFLILFENTLLKGNMDFLGGTLLFILFPILLFILFPILIFMNGYSMIKKWKNKE
ncbi:hypothetical protein [Gracilibacillus timonensis]|uniref:hypothetical protein n=1 Tax=Gracilibacillus timonensis TaxID=1816696 RepID=UPI000826F492|nr:hypothetical protein [Gracilibacillus timonensis]